MSSSLFFFSSRRRHTIFDCDWSSDVCSSDLSWTYSLLDMAIYPVLLIQYLGFFLPGLGSLERWIVALAMIWGATWLNLRGTRVVGTASGWFVAAVLAPFAVLSVAALVRWLGASATPFPVTPFHAAGTSFLGALGICVSQSILKYSGWDKASTIGGENRPRAGP